MYLINKIIFATWQSISLPKSIFPTLFPKWIPEITIWSILLILQQNQEHDLHLFKIQKWGIWIGALLIFRSSFSSWFSVVFPYLIPDFLNSTTLNLFWNHDKFFLQNISYPKLKLMEQGFYGKIRFNTCPIQTLDLING